jgi:drug/metabolite transporter (DMT)-like permease
MLYQILSLVGAAMILAAYVALQRGKLDKDDRVFNLLNFVGAGLLTVVAVADQRWGFIILEGTWSLLSLPPLLRRPTQGSRS